MVSSALGKALGLTEESTLEELKNGIVGVKDYTVHDTLLLFQWGLYNTSEGGSNVQLPVYPRVTGIGTGYIYADLGSIYFTKSFSKVVITFRTIIGGQGKGGYYFNYNYNDGGWAGISSYVKESVQYKIEYWYTDITDEVTFTFTNVNAGEHISFMVSRDTNTWSVLISSSAIVQYFD